MTILICQNLEEFRALAEELGANPDLTERVYREMIDGFIREEMAAHAGQR
jgi:isochorismate pyruvate lyase